MSLPSTTYQSPTTIFIVGPTASGKTALAIDLAEKLGAEIVCADSQTVRRKLDIGTAKPTPEDRRRVTHHMLDCIEPYDSYSVAAYQQAAKRCIEQIHAKNKIAIVCGGSGLYCDALFFDYRFSSSDRSDTAHESMGVAQLQEEITAKGLTLPKNATNKRHLLGVLRRGNETDVDRNTPLQNAVMIGVAQEDAVLKQRIALRIERMFETGLVDEVREVVREYGMPPTKLDAIGYPLVARYLQGELSLDEVKKMFNQGHWQYARRQRTWFKRNPYIHWISGDELDSSVIIDIVFSK